MKKSDLNEGQEVAVYMTTPVPTDPYARIYRHNVRRAKILSLEGDGVEVEYPDGNVVRVESRQVVSPSWTAWTDDLADRDLAASRQGDRRQAKLDAEHRALASAQRRYPTARIENHCVVVPIEDWLAVGE